MIFKLITEGDFCDKNICAVGSPKCDRCPRNFGGKIVKEEASCLISPSNFTM